LREGLGLAALEGMYCGLPVIGSNNRGLRDIVIDNESGYLGAYDDSDFFARAIVDLKENIEKRLAYGNKSKEIAQLYEIENVKQEVLALMFL
jgi:glycosyltransferase involved in cell wall biosynthesis